MLFAILILGEEDRSVYVEIDSDQKFKQYACFQGLCNLT